MAKGRRAKREVGRMDPLLAETEGFLAEGAPPPAAAAGVPEPVAGSDEAAAPGPAMELMLSPDGMLATIRLLPCGVTADQVLALLDAQGVTTGVDAAAIRQALGTATRTRRPVEGAVVARGRPARSTGAPRLLHRPPPGMEALPALDETARALALTAPDEVRAAVKGQRGWLVKAGRILAELEVASGAPGMTVRGETVAPGPGEDGLPEPGPGVAQTPGGLGYAASRCGYAGQLEGKPTVLAPFWMAADAMEVYLLALRLVPGSEALSAAELRAELTAAGVVVEADGEAVEALAAERAAAVTRSGLVKLAAGRPPTPPQDAEPEFSFHHRSRAGAVRADGSIDFRERNAFPAVHGNALLVRCRPAVPGAPGQTVRGEEVPVAAPRHAELVAGENVRGEERDGAQELYAEVDGGAAVQEEEVTADGAPLRRYTISVHPVTQVAGDVCYRTGNIEVTGSVAVAGSVLAGFRVRAAGDVVVSGGVDNGAIIEAGGSVTVQQGIVGADTRVKAGGQVAAKFVQEATVEAGGDVTVGSYIHNAEVRGGGQVRVEGAGGSGGGIVGGSVWGVRGIWTRNVGSVHTTGTRVYAGIDPALVTQIGAARVAAQRAEVLLRQLLQVVGLESLGPDEIRAALVRNPARKKIILHYVKKANEVAKARQTHTDAVAALMSAVEETTSAVVVEVADKACAGTSVQVGNRRIVLEEDLKAVRLFVDRQAEPPALRWQPLSEAPAG